MSYSNTEVHFLFCLECSLRAIKCPKDAMQMQSTFGAWMSDASQLDEGRYWLADHFSGDLFLHPNVYKPLIKAICELW